MSLGALSVGISGLEDAQTAINVIGNDIANSNTTGFKTSIASFQDAISQLLQGATPPGSTIGGTDPLQIGLGANLAAITRLFTQGQIQLTGNPTDLAVNGEGLFILQTPQGQRFTRDGAFTLNSNNILVDANGNFVQGFSATNGVVNTGSLGNISIPLGTLTIAQPTTLVTMGGNFDANATLVPTPTMFTVTSTVYDSLGNPNTFTTTFTFQGNISGSIPTDSNQWSYSMSAVDANGNVVPLGGQNVGVIDFTSTGTVDTTNSTGGGQPVVTVTTYPDGAASPQNITFNFSQFTQFAGQTTASTTNTNGAAQGTLDNFTIGQNGIITGSFTNGLTQVIGQVALANFTNPQGLQADGNNLFQATANSGTPQINAPETGSLGAVIGGALESSNVDLSKEFTNLIVAQDAFQANARTITTASTLFGDLIQAVGGV